MGAMCNPCATRVLKLRSPKPILTSQVATVSMKTSHHSIFPYLGLAYRTQARHGPRSPRANTLMHLSFIPYTYFLCIHMHNPPHPKCTTVHVAFSITSSSRWAHTNRFLLNGSWSSTSGERPETQTGNADRKLRPEELSSGGTESVSDRRCLGADIFLYRQLHCGGRRDTKWSPLCFARRWRPGRKPASPEAVSTPQRRLSGKHIKLSGSIENFSTMA